MPHILRTRPYFGYFVLLDSLVVQLFIPIILMKFFILNNAEIHFHNLLLLPLCKIFHNLYFLPILFFAINPCHFPSHLVLFLAKTCASKPVLPDSAAKKRRGQGIGDDGRICPVEYQRLRVQEAGYERGNLFWRLHPLGELADSCACTNLWNLSYIVIFFFLWPF